MLLYTELTIQWFANLAQGAQGGFGQRVGKRQQAKSSVASKAWPAGQTPPGVAGAGRGCRCQGAHPQGLPDLRTAHSQSHEADALLGTGPGQDLCQYLKVPVRYKCKPPSLSLEEQPTEFLKKQITRGELHGSTPQGPSSGSCCLLCHPVLPRRLRTH